MKEKFSVIPTNLYVHCSKNGSCSTHVMVKITYQKAMAKEKKRAKLRTKRLNPPTTPLLVPVLLAAAR